MNNLITNTVSNYLCFILKAIGGLVLTRILFLNLGVEDYGFWVLLWSVYGYTLLLDFGLGLSIQKSAAEYLKKNNYTLLSKQVSSVFFSYCFISILLIIASLLFLIFPIGEFKELFDKEKYLNVYLIFSICTCLIFPTGIFSEVLVGAGMMIYRNYVRLIFLTSNIIGVVYMSYMQIDLATLTIFTVVLHLISNVLIFIIVKIKIPNISITIKHFDIRIMKEMTSFSFNAYVIIFTNLILFNSDQLLIGTMLGTSATAVYHIATRLPFFMKSLNEQFQENVFPYMVTSSKKCSLFALQGNKYVGFISNLSFSFAFIFTEELISLWLGSSCAEICLIARFGLLYSYLSTILKSSNSPYLMAIGDVNAVAKISFLEVIINLFLTFVLINLIGVIGAIVASLVSLVIAMFVYIPFLVRRVKYKFCDWYCRVFSKNNKILLLNLIILFSLKKYVLIEDGSSKILLMGTGATILYVFLFLNYISKSENIRNRYVNYIKTFSLNW
jgi:O-antigen/teichoic acid export membrane protein